jgi:serine/threonine-protein phosphatase 6 regulatory ankyrin repeat subunit B
MKQICFLVFLLMPFAILHANDSDLGPAYTCMRMGDFSCAADLFGKQAKAGSTEAQCQLGKLYLSGRGVEQSPVKAQKWLRLAASSDDAAAQYALGVLLLGEGEQTEAAQWLEKAAAQNHRAALAKLKKISAAELQGDGERSEQEIQQQWYKAVVGCRYKEIKRGLKAGVKVNQSDNYQRTALYYVVACGDAGAVTDLLKKGAEPNTVDKYGESPLKLAVRKNETRIAGLLLQHGARANSTNSSQESLLHIAVTQCSEPMVAVLLKAKAAHSAVNRAGETPLDLAIDLQQKPIEQLLLAAGAHHSKHWSPIQQPSSAQTLSYLEEGKGTTGDGLWQSAVQAIRHDQTTVLLRLLEKNPDALLSTEDDKHRTLLMYATELQNEESVEMLIKQGARASQLNSEGVSALMIAAKRGDNAGTAQLLQLGADPTTKDKQGRDATHLALLAEQSETAMTILKRGRLPSARTLSGQTYLMLAIQAGATEVVDWLFAHNIHPDLQDAKGRSALWYAANACDLTSFKHLIETGANALVTDSQGNALLHVAANRGCSVVIKQLCSTNIDLNVTTSAGNTALILATEQKHTAIAEVLLANGADFSIQNSKGDTALIAAVREHDSLDLVANLLTAGSDPYRRNQLGESALSTAEKYNPEAAELIRKDSKFSFF